MDLLSTLSTKIWSLNARITVTVVAYLIIDIIIDQPQNLINVVGIVTCIVVIYVTSKHPSKVNWHTVFWGFVLHFIVALLLQRTYWGVATVNLIGDRITKFMEYAITGAECLLGGEYVSHYFFVKLLSTVTFFCIFINLSSYLGVMQPVILVIGRFLTMCMRIMPVEAVSASSNMFMFMHELPVILRSFLKSMTRSELHAVMTGGFATVTGSVFAGYVSFGVPANHIISASIMSVPVALAISKLSYPETEIGTVTFKDVSKIQTISEKNIIEAVVDGAVASTKVVVSITVNLLAFMSLLSVLNAVLILIGESAGLDNLTFELASSYILYPVAYLMGIETADCRKVSVLLGLKTFTNEFVAHGQLKDLIANRHILNNYTVLYNTTAWFWQDGNVVLNITNELLKGGVISEKSEIMSSYAFCGFANLAAVGPAVQFFSLLAPTRKPDISKIVIRAMICGNAACFITACITGLLYQQL